MGVPRAFSWYSMRVWVTERSSVTTRPCTKRTNILTHVQQNYMN